MYEISWFCILDIYIILGLLLPGTGRDQDLCMEGEKSKQSRKTGCYGQSFGEGHYTISLCLIDLA